MSIPIESGAVHPRTAFTARRDGSPFPANTRQAVKAGITVHDQRIMGGISSGKPYMKNRRSAAN